MDALLDTPSLRFERRASNREPARGSAMAAFSDEDGALVLTRVDLVDRSERGLGLLSPVPVAPGERFAIYAGATPLARTTGVVTRCSARGHCFRLGLRCDQRAAA